MTSHSPLPLERLEAAVATEVLGHSFSRYIKATHLSGFSLQSMYWKDISERAHVFVKGGI